MNPLVKDNWFNKHPIATYLILANGITWLGWIPALFIASKQGYLLPTMDGFAAFVRSGFSDINHVIVVVVFSLAVYGPIIGALIVTRMVSGKVGVTELWGKITKWRIGVRWYLAVLLTALVLSRP